ncbi:MAG: aromatic ring-hydroxylating dioxygenase subunit alpha [Geminicoccaceae bacterium]
MSQFDQVRRPVAEAHGLPSALYTDSIWCDEERKRVFFGGWACVGIGADVPNIGDAAPIDFYGVPLLLVRGRDGGLKLFQNVCRHRGMILVSEKTNTGGLIRCPYHAWSYALDGRLRATPHVGGAGQHSCAAIDPAQTGLLEVRSGVFLDAVFADLSGAAEPFDDFIAPIRARWADFADRPLYHGGAESRFTLEIKGNWKLAVENYCESYHLPFVHPGLNSYSRLEDHYNIERQGHYAGQGTHVFAPSYLDNQSFPDFPDLPDRWSRAAEYLALFPNVLFGVHRDHVFSIRLEPMSADGTREHVEIYYADPAAAHGDDFKALREHNARMWKDVFVEDIFVVEGMQQGRGAPGFDGGRFSPAMDGPPHCFHDWVAARMAGAAA